VDDAQGWQRLGHLASALAGENVPAYLEKSRHGGHLWLFLAEAAAGRDARAFGLGLLAAHRVEGVELFPKQDQIADAPGSLIRMPFGMHRLTSALLDRLTHRCHILEFAGESYRFRQSLQRQADLSAELSRS
jgi:hypothetical protein